MSVQKLQQAFEALRRDLITDSGPQISTLRNYPFAILVYSPQDEFDMRQELRKLTSELTHSGWFLHTVNIKALILECLRNRFSDAELDYLIEEEELVTSYDGPRIAFDTIKGQLAGALEGPDGLAGLIAAEIDELANRSDRADRTVVFVGQLAAMFPMVRLSSLLKVLDGKTHGIPVVFLYPGSSTPNGLKFLDEALPDNDYRPRIYTSDSLVI